MKKSRTFLGLSLVVLLAVGAIAAGGAEVGGRGLYRLVGLFGQVVGLVRSSWVEEVEVERLEMGAITGLVESGDPGGVWVPEEHAALYASLSARNEPAFGLVLGKRGSYPFVLAVLPGSPAARAGLTPGEFVERIAGEPVRARPLWLPRVLLERGEQGGMALTLDVIDRFLEGKKQVELQPRQTPPTAAQVTVEDGVPVLRVSVLSAISIAEIERGLLVHGGAAALVVDARGAALGSAQDAVTIAAVIAGGAVQVALQDRSGVAGALKAQRSARSWRVIVCIDNTTAGPAETLACALKGQGATLVGGESYGDTGQREARAAAGGQLWLARRWCLGPDGKALLGDGLKPDEAVRPRKEGDAVLGRALELARGQGLRKAA
ncbi:MAG: S41 family peptidase [Acidobacteriota bacterium]